MLQIGVQNGTKGEIHWDWSEPMPVESLLIRMDYLANAGSWREENGYPNALKIRLCQ